MISYRLTPRALEDLEFIWEYSETEHGVQQAVEYTGQINSAFRRISENPLLYRERENYTPPVRMCHQGVHVVVYVCEKNGVLILRILHGTMDFEAHLAADVFKL